MEKLERVVKEKALYAIREFFPKTKKGIEVSPYSEPVKVIKEDYYWVRVKYDGSKLKKDLELVDIVNAFRTVGELITGQQNITTEVTVSLNSSEEYMQFIYGKDDKDSGNIVNHFIELLKEKPIIIN